MSSRRNRRALLCAALSVLSLAAPVSAQSIIPPDPSLDLLEEAALGRARGSQEARVVVFEIADFQCPYCAQFAQDVFPRIDSAYVRTGLVQWVFVNLPLPAHREAWSAAEVALCAGAVANRFWEVHDALYQRQEEWSNHSNAPQRLAAIARSAGASGEEYDRCVREDRVAPLIVQDLLGATAANISGTPTFIVNRESKIVGLRTFEEWREVLDQALAATEQ